MWKHKEKKNDGGKLCNLQFTSLIVSFVVFLFSSLVSNLHDALFERAGALAHGQELLDEKLGRLGLAGAGLAANHATLMLVVLRREKMNSGENDKTNKRPICFRSLFLLLLFLRLRLFRARTHL